MMTAEAEITVAQAAESGEFIDIKKRRTFSDHLIAVGCWIIDAFFKAVTFLICLAIMMVAGVVIFIVELILKIVFWIVMFLITCWVLGGILKACWMIWGPKNI